MNTYGTQLKASRNLALTSGDGINYFAVTDQKLETAKRNERTGWTKPLRGAGVPQRLLVNS